MLKNFVEQASRLPYSLDERGRYAMTTKEKMRSQGIKSPDISDTCCFAFLAYYQPAANDSQSTARENKMLELARQWMRAEEDSFNADKKEETRNNL